MSAEDEGRRGRLVEAARADNVVEAEVMRQVLEDAGVRCLVQNTDALSAPTGGAVARSLAILVLEQDAPRAAALLRDGPQGGAPAPRRRPPRLHRRR